MATPKEKVKGKSKKKKKVNPAVEEVSKAKKETAVTTPEAPKKEEKKAAPKKKKAVAPKVDSLTDTSSKLPKAIAERKIVAKATGNVNTISVAIGDIKATSQCVYVDDIHHANPTPLQTIYWLILKNNAHVVVRVDSDVYDDVVKQTGADGKTIPHLYSVVDCSVIPTLTYGSWKYHEIKGFPTMAQIKLQDTKMKQNDSFIHNHPVKIELYKGDTTDVVEEEEDDAMFDFEDEDEEFDFADDDGEDS